MLSRVAASLYWMARHLERAGATARLVDIHLQLLLDLRDADAEKFRSNWMPLVACLGCQAAYRKAGAPPDCNAVTEFLVFDSATSLSLLGAIRAARENARSIREQIAEDMWEQLNRLHLWAHGKGARQLFARSPYDFFQRVREECHLWDGLTASTMPYGQAWEFLRLGRSIERAEKTTRMLDDKFHLSGPRSALLQWAAVLRGCGARQAYQRKYSAAIQPRLAADLLLLDESFPRAVEFCVREADLALHAISGASAESFSNTAEKLSGRLFADLKFSSIDDYLAQGLHQAMDSLQIRLNDLAAAAAAEYFGENPRVLEPRQPAQQQ